MRVGESGRLYVKASESKASNIAESDLLESNSNIINLKAFVCLFLIIMAMPQDRLKG